MDRFNLAAAAVRPLQRGLRHLMPGGRSLLPLVVFWEPTMRCQQRCPVCMFYGKAGQVDPAGELPLAQALRVVDTLCDAYRRTPRRPALCLSGGEIFLFRGIVELTQRLHAEGIRFAMLTNLMNVSREKIDGVLAAQPDEICISLDGPPAVHDRLRGVPRAFERTIESVRYLRDRARGTRTRLRFNCALSRANRDHLPALVAVARAEGIPLRIQLLHFVDGGAAAEHEAATRAQFGEALRPRSDTDHFSAAEGEGFRHAVADVRVEARRAGVPLSFLPPLPTEEVADYYADFTGYAFASYCSAPWTTVRINQRGDVYPCYEHIWGNVFEASFASIWNGGRARHFRRVIKREKLLPGCRRCPKLTRW